MQDLSWTVVGVVVGGPPVLAHAVVHNRPQLVGIGGARLRWGWGRRIAHPCAPVAVGLVLGGKISPHAGGTACNEVAVVLLHSVDLLLLGKALGLLVLCGLHPGWDFTEGGPTASLFFLLFGLRKN